MNKRKKASYGMKKMRGGDYMEPNKELRFGAAKGKKPKRRRAGNGDTVEEQNKAVRDQYSLSERLTGKMREDIQSGTVREPVKTKVDSKGNQMIGTDADIKKMKSMKAKSKSSGSYSAAKKRDSNLDSYIKQRNAAEKGSLDYNEAQNKINKAYGKGPTNRRTTYGTEKKGQAAPDSAKRLGPPKNSEAKPTLQMNMTSTKTPTPAPKSDKETKIEARTAKKVGKIQDRRAKAAARKEDRADAKNNRSADKMFKKNEREGAKADRKQGRMDNRADRQEAKASREGGRQMKKEAKQIKRDNIKATRAQGRAEKAAARKMEKGGVKPGRKKAFLGVAKAVGQVANIAGKIAPEGSKVSNIAGKVQQGLEDPLGTAIGVGKNLIQGNNPLEGIGGQQQPAAPTTAPAPATATATPPPATQPGQPGQPVQPQARYGKKKKGKKGTMKYKAGGAKPDFPDLDNDGNKTEPMSKALKDRRKRGGRR